MSRLRFVVVILATTLGAPTVQAQSEATSQRSPGGVLATCTSQHEAQPGLSAADLLGRNYVIKAAVPGGVWLQKKSEVFYCNAGVTRDDETVCWKLRAPLRGQNCTDAINRARSKALPS